MPDRTEILTALNASQERLFTRYQTFSSGELASICTQSEASDGNPWTPKDHLAHLTLIEQAFQGIIHRTLQGKSDPIGFTRSGLKSRPEILAWIHQQNQAYVDAHHADSLETVLADLAAARKDSLMLLEQLTDEQLSLPVAGAPWADGTIGGLLITNAHHATQHLAWVEQGLQISHS